MLSHCLILSTCTLLVLAVDPYSLGPHPVDHVTINPEFMGELDHYLEIYTPSTEGKFPVIMFFPGFACTTNVQDYSRVLSHIASWGYVVIGPWVTFYNPLQTYKAEWVVHVINWAKVHLDPRYAADWGIHEGLEIDFDTMFLGAQSSGSHVAVNYLALQQQNQECGHIHGMFLMSPVDGADPYGIVDETCITPPKKLNFQVPTLIVSGGLDSQPGLGDGLGGLWPACAPEDLSNERFYDALTGPTVWVNTTDYGHIDCLDDGPYNLAAGVHLCATNRDMDRDVYRDYLAGQAVAFLRYFQLGDCSMQDQMTSMGLPEIQGWVETKGAVEDLCGFSSCSWSQSSQNFIRL